MFPAEIDKSFDLPLLGDIVICAPIVQKEADDAVHHGIFAAVGLFRLIGMAADT